MDLSCLWSLLFTFLIFVWLKIGSRGFQAHLKSLVRSNYADSQMESFWRRIGVEIDFSSPEPELAMQNGGFASRVGGGMPPLP